MAERPDDWLPTRATLLQRLKDWQDHSSWQEFFDIYGKLIYGVARKSGLTDAETQDVLQETMLSVAKHMPAFKYDPVIGSFKAWLLNMTRWRIIDQLRKRQPMVDQAAESSVTRTDPIQAVPDPNGLDMDAMWAVEWETALLHTAMENMKRRIDPQRYQVFDFYVNKEWPPEKVADRFGISIDQVYQIKHRVTDALRTEVQRLEKEMT